jgi:hypothetical protein
LRAGLERLAGSAGLQIVEEAEAADLVLCCTDDSEPAPPRGVTVVVGNVIVTCHGKPDPVLWETVRQLICRALAG